MCSALESWFNSRGWDVFDFQRETWRAYRHGESGLVHAPTGTGKTYAVWGGPLIEQLESENRAASRDALRVLWITPLRALANDTVESLRAPLEDLDIPWRVELRTGDTSSSARKRQREKTPHVLVTTPESLSVMLSYADRAKLFSSLRCVIMDEWHELMSTKRGVQAELGLAAVRALSPNVRIWGLSATLGNLDEAMRTLLGPRLAPRGRLVHSGLAKTIAVETLLPESIERFPWAGHLGTRLLPQVLEKIRDARSTLLFTNTRSQAEIWFQSLLTADPDLLGRIALHHGSLDRAVRSEVESMLRAGRLKAVACTSSLDLGVDFSPVDQVIQVGSPKGVARLMQRAGRSGHQPGAISRVIGVPTNALELIEFTAARDAIDARRIESRPPIDRPLDVLVQHIVTRAMGDGFDENQLKEEVRSTHAFADLTDEQWSWCMDFLVQGGRTLGAYPQYQRIEQRNGRYVVSSTTIARLHRASIGTITSDTAMQVRFARGKLLGTIEESFIMRLRPGDRFVFAGRVLELVRVREMTAQVKPATSRSGAVPRWVGGKSPLSTELADAVSERLTHAAAGEFTSIEMQTIRPLLELQARWSRIPRDNALLIDHTRTREGWHVFVFPMQGRLVHEGLATLVAHRLTQPQPSAVHISGNDYGFEVMSQRELPVDEATWRELLSEDRLLDDLLGAVNTSQLARRHFREIARVAGLIFQGYPGQPKSMRHLQASSELFFDVFTEFDPENLLLDQARREVLDRELEVRRLRRALRGLHERTFEIVHTPQLSPLAFPIWAETLRSQHITSERWIDRVRRMVEKLEDKAMRHEDIEARSVPA